MRRPTGSLERCDESQQAVIFKERSILDRKIDLSQIHRNHTSRPDIGMPYFGIAHLTCGQAYIRAMGDQQIMRTGRNDPVECRRIGQCWRVRNAVLPVAPAVQNAQHNRFRDGHRTSLLRDTMPLSLLWRRGEPLSDRTFRTGP